MSNILDDGSKIESELGMEYLELEKPKLQQPSLVSPLFVQARVEHGVGLSDV
jgi:hypothetical protein